MTFIKSKYSSLRLNTDEIFKEISIKEIERRREAGKAAAKVMRKNVKEKKNSLPGNYPGRVSGSLFRSIRYKMVKNDRSVAVGTNAPHAHLLEFGHGDGKTRNKRPFITPSLLEAEDEVIKIMSEPYF